MAIGAEALGIKNAYIKRLVEEGFGDKPIRSHWQGASRLAHALLAGLELGAQDRREAELVQQERASANAIAAALGGSGAQQPTSPAAAPTQIAALPPQSDVGPFPGTPPTTSVIPSGRQAAEGVVSAVPQSGPNAGVNIAPGINADALRGLAPKDVRSLGMEVLKKRLTREPDKPSYGVVGNDQFGNPVHGWIDPAARSTTPATGGQPTFKEADTLRKQVQDLPSYKNLSQAAPVYKSMLDAAGRNTRASDVNLIYGMAKLMDPGSVVRESEMTIAQAIATLPQNLQAQIKSQLSATGRLDPTVRAGIMQEAFSRVQSYQGMFDQDAGFYRGIVQRARMNEADVLPTFGPFQPFKVPDDPSKPPQEVIDAAIQEYLRRQGKL